MKSNKKSKQSSLFQAQKSVNKFPLQKSANITPPNINMISCHPNIIYSNSNPSSKTNTTSNEHRKLLQYRDYLMSLRKMDLGSLIKRDNRQKRKQSENNYQHNTNQLNHTQPLKNKASTGSAQNDVNKVFKLMTADFSQNTKQFQAVETVNPESFRQQSYPNQLDGQETSKFVKKQSSIKNKQNFKNSFTMCLKQSIEQTDLYCEENMDDLMNNFKPSTPRLLHIGNYEGQTRNLSTNRADKRQFSMPSIEERNLSEQSQSSLTNNKCFRGNNQHFPERKYNSCSHKNTAKEQITPDFKQKQKKSIIQLPTSCKSKNRLETQKKQISTKEANTNSGNKSFRQKMHQDVTTNPFNFRTDIKMEKENQKLKLNVSQIVKRINSRESKSSMSDRSHKKKEENNYLNEKYQEVGHQNIIKHTNQKTLDGKFEKANDFSGKKRIEVQLQSKGKSFKTQLKQFRQKHFLMMKLCA